MALDSNTDDLVNYEFFVHFFTLQKKSTITSRFQKEEHFIDLAIWRPCIFKSLIHIQELLLFN